MKVVLLFFRKELFWPISEGCGVVGLIGNICVIARSKLSIVFKTLSNQYCGRLLTDSKCHNVGFFTLLLKLRHII